MQLIQMNTEPDNMRCFIAFRYSILTLLLSSCSLMNNTIGNDYEHYQFLMSKTTCRGNCPVYSITLYGNGQISYEGFQNVNTIGRQQGSIQTDSVIAILQELNRMQYYDLKYEYSHQHITDMPSVITQIIYSKNGIGSSKQVVDYQGDKSTPIELRKLYDRIESMIAQFHWIR